MDRTIFLMFFGVMSFWERQWIQEVQGQFFPKLIPLNTSYTKKGAQEKWMARRFWVIYTSLKQIHLPCNVGASIPNQCAFWNKEAGLGESRDPFLSTDTVVTGLATWSHVSFVTKMISKARKLLFTLLLPSELTGLIYSSRSPQPPPFLQWRLNWALTCQSNPTTKLYSQPVSTSCFWDSLAKLPRLSLNSLYLGWTLNLWPSCLSLQSNWDGKPASLGQA